MENWDSLLGNQIGIAVLTTGAINWLKKTPFCPFLSRNTENLNRWIGAGVAFLGTVGLTIQTAGSAATGWDIGIHVPSLGALVTSVIQMSSGVGLQQASYKLGQLVIDPSTLVVNTSITTPAKTTVEQFPSVPVTDGNGQ